MGDDDGDGWLNYLEIQVGSDSNDNTDVPLDVDGDGIADDITPNASAVVEHQYQISGTYFVRLKIKNELGCYKEVEKQITIGKGYYVLKPNVFTPNGDGINDIFTLYISGFNSVSFNIYDYRGNLVYNEAQKEPDPLAPQGLDLNGWDGSTENGSPYYVFEFQGILYDGTTVISESGPFIILK